MPFKVSLIIIGCMVFASIPCSPQQEHQQTPTHLAATPSESHASEPNQVLPGIDVLLQDPQSYLNHARVGLITNQTGLTRSRKSTIDALFEHPEIALVALFGPEHGIRGSIPAGEEVASYTDTKTGLQVYSLYGSTKHPTPAMLEQVEILLYDIQDIGTRGYTYISTMSYGMEAAARANIPFIVLDRPIIYPGTLVSGNIQDAEQDSIVGRFPIPYMYGMTCGELALMINEQGWLADALKCDLLVVPVQNYTRGMWYKDTGLIWIQPSPHIPHWDTGLFCAATGILGELNTINIGVGSTLPFETVAHPDFDAHSLAQAMNALQLSGVYFHPISYPIFYGRLKGQTCHGVRIIFDEPNLVDYVPLQFYCYETIMNLYPESKLLEDAWESCTRMFDLVCGTPKLRQDLLAGKNMEAINAEWKADQQEFLTLREPYLLYPE